VVAVPETWLRAFSDADTVFTESGREVFWTPHPDVPVVGEWRTPQIAAVPAIASM
jgi:hypothetical protein